MDEVMADSSTRLADMYQAEFGIDLHQQVWDNGCKVYDLALDGLRTYVRNYLHQPGFFASLKIFDDAARVVERLNDQHEVFICSAALEFPLSLVEKIQWLQKYLPFITHKQIIFCGGRKRFLDGDYIIDDHINNLEAFKGTGLLYHASHNIHETRFTRLHNWLDIEQYFFGQTALT